MPVYFFKKYRRSQKGATSGSLCAMHDVGADDLADAERKVSGEFAHFDFDWYFAVLEREDGAHEFSYWFQKRS